MKLQIFRQRCSRRPGFQMALIVAGVITLAEIGGLFHERAAAEAAAKGLRAHQREWKRLKEIRAGSTRGVVADSAEDLARVRGRVREREAELAAVRLVETAAPTSRTDAYFDLAAFVERSRELARTSGVTIAPEAANFGFAAYAHEAPPTSLIAAVFKQRVVTGKLLELLLAAQPRAVLRIERERPKSEQQPGGLERAGAGRGSRTSQPATERERAGDGPDYFSLDRRLSITSPGVVETTALRIAFTGQTATLRSFLNRLSASGFPLYVRSVEVVPVNPTARTESANRPVARPSIDIPPSVLLRENRGTNGDAAVLPDQPVSMVARSDSKFTVTIESLELTGVSSAQGQFPPGPASSDAWRPPVAQSRGRDWIYDAFTPPELLFDTQAHAYTVRSSTAWAEEPDDLSGIEVIAIRPEPFHLRLIGQLGQADDWRGAFENTLTGEIFLATAGRALPGQGVAIDRVKVTPTVLIAESMTENRGGTATMVRDLGSGKSVTLAEGLSGSSGTMMAVIALAGETGEREVREGDRFHVADADYFVERIAARPATITLVRTSPKHPLPERRVLLAPAPAVAVTEETL